jgi:TonB family protein
LDSSFLKKTLEKKPQFLTPPIASPKPDKQRKTTAKIIKQQTELPEQVVEDETGEENFFNEDAFEDDEEEIEDLTEMVPSPANDDQHATKEIDQQKVLKIIQKWKKQPPSNQEAVVKNSEEIVSKRRKFIQGVIAKKADIISRKRLVTKWKNPAMSKAMLRFYLAQVNRVILQFWEIPVELDPTLRVRVKVRVGKKGLIESFEIVQFSGNKLLDQAVQKVFRRVKAFPPLPNWYKGTSLEFGLNFTPAAITGN